ETREWLDALGSLVRAGGRERARFVLDALQDEALRHGLAWKPRRTTPYLNTIAVESQPPFPGDLETEQRLAALMRWNALAMVVRANRRYGELGGHIASYASAADLFEVGFNHFFRARSPASGADAGGDLVYFQPHSAPGVYARAFLEGRLSEDDLAHYRQEIAAPAAGARGLCSYPHPWLMPDFWQFPTGSMGLGPLSAVYQARFMRYLQHRGLLDTAERRGTDEDAAQERRGTNEDAAQERRVWGFFGDGEMDEPESLAGLSLAAREGLDNLVFVVNCNLQRLDGPVRGNGRIVDELETLFAGAGWHVIKLLWGSDWDALFARDRMHSLARAFARTVDGEFQTFSANDGAFNRARFFGQSPETAALVGAMTDGEIDRLHRGGHDLVKIHAAYAAAVAHRGAPVVVLAKTMKGYGMGRVGQGRMTTHSQKKLEADELKAFVRRFRLPISDDDAAEQRFVRPAVDSAEMRYLHARRAALGGPLPARRADVAALALPPLQAYAGFALRAAGKEMSTTMAFVRMLSGLLKDAALGPRTVPIVADEARTFGMAALFRQVGIYAPQGQRYEPEDAGSLTSYREARDGQLLEEGISEAGALASWTAAATSYSTHGLAMLPFYIYYSMFGFQRVGDLIWAAADQRARGFLIGATAGRTTLGGEGLQHQDGQSHLFASTVPNCVAYDPGFAYELALLLQHGLQRMCVEREDVFFYLTVGNENLPQPSLPEGVNEGVREGVEEGVEEGVKRGLYRLPASVSGIAPPAASTTAAARCTLIGSGTLLAETVAAAALLAADWGVAAEVCSATSYTELARDGQRCEQRRLAGDAAVLPWATQVLQHTHGPVLAISDYVRALPEQIRAWLPPGRAYATLGTDGFGRSDTRAQLRRHFGVDRWHIAWRALVQLAEAGALPHHTAAEAARRYAIGAAG
ncbi:MAG TPA: pyruvate dehydrogenase (acetyl-transferring), homodimeric type, partial [Rubrivivax sp.]|nr:pyruvate dehydrogenase (acetyl-transferring), homodimeric type [Rubrivivax sp.]